MGIRSGIAGWTGSIFTVGGVLAVIYAGVLKTHESTGPMGMEPIALGVIGIASAVMVGPLVKQTIERLLLVG